VFSEGIVPGRLGLFNRKDTIQCLRLDLDS
jgi:hypothetical protein